MSSVLLDTCAILFIADNRAISPIARDRIIAAAAGGGLYVSPVSAWEIGLLSSKGRVQFRPDPKTWFNTFAANPGIRVAALTSDIAIESCFLPPPLHGDPADRLLIATARHLGIPIVTRDRKILDYGAAGLIGAVAC